MDDKQGKFERLAEKRVTEAIKKLRLIGNLANKRNYSYNDDNVRQIVDSLDAELKQLKSRFKDDTGYSACGFTFKKHKNN